MSHATSAGARVLVVEDEPSLRRILRVYLAEQGYAATIASDAEEALALLERERFDVVLTDLRLPTLSGLE
ncbi:MAG TPA: response regulator, partial [Archangium sp.]